MRDTALRRLLRAKRWILAASLALTGAFVGLAANAFPGKTVKTSSPGARNEQGSTGSSSPGQSTEGSSSSVTPPEQAPQSAEQSGQGSSSGEQGSSPSTTEAPVVSGGS